MYPTVPITAPSFVAVVGIAVEAWVSAPPAESFSVSLARPKSSTLAKPSPVTLMFSGLRSRCTMPAEYALAQPSAAWARWTRSARGSIDRSANSFRRVVPSTSFKAMSWSQSVQPGEVE